MDDSISRQAAIEALADYISNVDKVYSTGRLSDADCRDAAESVLGVDVLPSAQPEPCELCSNLEKGDTLYQYSDWDGGIGFDYIRDIQFCPKCGRRLKYE